MRKEQIDAQLDQYHLDHELLWWRWCEEQIRNAHFVLMICTPEYKRRIENPYENPEEGLGVCWEADYIYQRLYELKGRNPKYLPLLLDENGQATIPERLRGYSFYKLQKPYKKSADFKTLLNRLRGIKTPPPPLGPGISERRAAPATFEAQEFSEGPIAASAAPGASFGHTPEMATERARAAAQLIDNYGRAGNLPEAQKLFEAMAEFGSTPEVALWRTKASLSLKHHANRLSAQKSILHVFFRALKTLGSTLKKPILVFALLLVGVFVPSMFLFSNGIAPAPPFHPPSLEALSLQWQTIAHAPLSETWSNEKAYSRYVDGRFNLATAKRMRIVFAPSQAGTKFLLRLVPMGAEFDRPIGVRWEPIHIPADGIVTLPLKAADFGLTADEMAQLVQIAIISGDNAWGRSLGQEADKRADFETIEVR